MLFEIKNRWSGAVIFKMETTSIKLCVEAAVVGGADLRGANLSAADLRGANLSGANLSGADLSGANLRGANLSAADLSGANLSGANLRGADLSAADLSGANLRGANLSGADLSGANLSGANLSGADLSGANLSGANLSAADLSGADLSAIRDDFWAVLSSAPTEVEGLRTAIVEGRIDGSTYDGECACLVGTMEKVAALHNEKLVVLKRNQSRPAERFFLNIKQGDTPETNQSSKIVLEWLDQWLNSMQSTFGGKIEKGN